MNKMQVVEYSNRSIYQEMNFFLKTINLNTPCDPFTLEKIFCEQFDGFLVDPVDPTQKWWTTVLLLNQFRAQEITWQLIKDEQNCVCVEIIGRRQQPTENDTKAEIRRVIRLPVEVDTQFIRVLFTCEGFVIVKVPFLFTDEQKFNWMNRYMNINDENMFCQTCYNVMATPDLVLPETMAKCTCVFNTTTQLLNGWGPVITEEMREVQTQIYQLLPLLRPYRAIPYFLKENQGKTYKIILDLVMCEVIRPEEIQVLAKDQRITFELKTNRKYFDGRVENNCHAKKCFFVPSIVKLDQLEVRLMPNGHLRFIMPVDLKEKILNFEGETITIKH